MDGTVPLNHLSWLGSVGRYISFYKNKCIVEQYGFTILTFYIYLLADSFCHCSSTQQPTLVIPVVESALLLQPCDKQNHYGWIVVHYYQKFGGLLAIFKLRCRGRETRRQGLVAPWFSTFTACVHDRYLARFEPWTAAVVIVNHLAMTK